MSNFTGNLETDKLILLELDDKSLKEICQTDKYFKNLCEYEDIWLNKLVKLYDGPDVLKGKGKKETYREYYTSMRHKSFMICKLLRDNIVQSQLVIDDFYNHRNGFYNKNLLGQSHVLIYLIIKIALNYAMKHDKSQVETIQFALNYNKEKLIEDRDRDRYIDDVDLDSYLLTEKDILTFLKIINVNVSRRSVLNNIGKSYYVHKMDSTIRNPKQLPKIARFIQYIHTGFVSRKLPLDITWNKLCTNDYVLEYKI